VLAVPSSLVEPAPHQIKAVDEEMLPHQALAFLLAEDPDAGNNVIVGRSPAVRCRPGRRW
jgi:hypothetical protein